MSDLNERIRHHLKLVNDMGSYSIASDLLTEAEQRIQQLESTLTEIDEYLNHRNGTSIYHDSGFHKQIKQALRVEE